MAEIPKGSFRFFINLRHCENLHFKALLILATLYAGAWQSTFVDITSLIDIKIFFATFCRQKVAQKPRGDNFRGHTQKFSKTDAFALLLREKVSVF